MFVEFNGKQIQIELWDGYKDPPVGDMIGIDTETLKIVVGEPYVPATLQMYWPNRRFVQVVQGGDQIRAYLRKALQSNIGAELVFHNACFDLEVLGGRDNNLLMNAVRNDRVTDIGLRYLLRKMAIGEWKDKQIPKWSLDHITKELLGIVLSKDENIRLTFTPDQPLTDEHIMYAGLDPVATVECRMLLPQEFPTERLQVRGSIALHQIGYDGFAVDYDRFSKLREKFDLLAKEHEKVLKIFGYHPGVSGNKAVQQEILANLEKRSGKVFPRSAKKGDIQVGKSLLALFEGEPAPPFIDSWRKMDHYRKMGSTYFNEDFLGKNDKRMHCSYNSLVLTGRTSCRNPNHQNIPRGDGIRGVYVAPEGHALFACDYSTLELCALAETCYQRYKQSTMRELINAATDLHKWFGYEVLMAKTGGNKNDGIDYRQMAKACYSADTELLTRDGWKRIDELYGQDVEVKQYDPYMDTLSWTKPLDWIKKENQTLLHIHGRNMDAKVTPDHRMLSLQLKRYSFHGNKRLLDIKTTQAKSFKWSMLRQVATLKDAESPTVDLSAIDDLQKVKLPGKHTVYCLSVPKTWVVIRSNGKISVQGNCNFGFPGGLGSETFMRYAKIGYGVTVTKEQAIEMKELWLEAFPEMKLHLEPMRDPDDDSLFIGRTITGRYRSKSMFCAACNYPLTV